MKTFQYVIQDEVGIHARPAGMLVKKAGEFQSQITIRKGEKSADARHLFAIMGLAVKHGETIAVEVEGPDEAAAAEAMEEFLKENL
jgi:phosphocarrier protein